MPYGLFLKKLSFNEERNVTQNKLPIVNFYFKY